MRTARPHYLPLLAAVVVTLTGSSAGAQSAAARDSVFQRYRLIPRLITGGLVEPHWIDGGKRFWFASESAGTSRVLVVDPGANTTRVVDRPPGTPPKEISAERVAHLRPHPASSVWDGDEILSPDSARFLVARAGDLWLRSTADDRETRLTTDGGEKDGWTTRTAMWSRDSRHLVAMRSDMRRVHFMPVVRWLGVREQVEWKPYWLTGDSLPQNRLALFDAASMRTIPIALEPRPDQDFELIGFDERGDVLRVLRHDRFLQWVELIAIDVATGRARVVLTERSKTFIEGLRFSSVASKMFTPVGDGRFLWLAERDGWNHLYLYDSTGTLVRQLTTGDVLVHDVVAVDARGGWIYVTASADRARPYDVHGYRVRFDGTGFTRLSEAVGQHRIALSPTREWLIDTHAALDRAATTELRRADGRLVRVLARADTSALASLHRTPPREFVVKAADGSTDLHGVLFVPFDFDSTKRYPVVEFIYQGMHSITAPKSIYAAGTCDVSMCPQPLAQLGFVTFVVDGRGTPGRGKAFQDAAWHAVGRYETDDHVGALRQLAATRPWMDMGRVGIVGYSFGGYFAMRALLQAPSVYAAGVVGAPVVDFESATPGVIEPYLGPFAENRASYDFASNLRLADSLRARVLLIHGTGDVNAPFSQTMKMVAAFTKAGRPYDLIVLPEEDHMSVGFGSEYALERMKRYLIEHLTLSHPVTR